MSVLLTTKPQFLYPISRQFPFDEVAENIVRALEKRNWKVPGLKIEFHTYGSGEAKFQKVENIIGDNFKMQFRRNQGIACNRWNDTAALQSVCIPMQMLEVFKDESGPNYYLYVGNNWDADKEWFMNDYKVHSRLNKEPRRYLRYKGNTYNQRPKELVSDNDLGREYSPIGDEPVCINFEQKFNEFTEWLQENVLNYILSFPEADVIESPVPMEEPIPYNGPWNTIYSVCDWSNAERLEQGKNNPSELPPDERHAYFGRGYRLVPLDVPCNGRFPKTAYEGFIWCDVTPRDEITNNTKLTYVVMNAMSSLYRNSIIEIHLKYANDVYVVDNALYEDTRQQLFETKAPGEFLTNEEIGKAYAARGTTIVPITEYKGDYKEPIVLIKRELEFEEIGKIV